MTVWKLSVQNSNCQYRKSVVVCKTVLAAAYRVINEFISYDKIPLITVLHCNICTALKIFVEFCSYLWKASHQQERKHCVTVCATRNCINSANLSAPGSRCIHCPSLTSRSTSSVTNGCSHCGNWSFKVILLKFYIAEIRPYILLKLVQFTSNK